MAKLVVNKSQMQCSQGKDIYHSLIQEVILLLKVNKSTHTLLL